MLKKSITYTNPFTDEEVTEDHYFHISKADLVEMEMEAHDNRYEKDGETLTGMHARLQRIVDSNDGKAIITEFKELIRRSYGKKVGDRFVKSDSVWQDFVSSEAYSQLIYELCTDATAASEFTVGVIPGNLDQELARLSAVAQMNGETASELERREATAEDIAAIEDRQKVLDEATPENPVKLTQDEAEHMTREDLKSGLSSGRFDL